MKKTKTADDYYEQEHQFKDAIAHLRELAHKTEAVEMCKWGIPVYTIDNKNVFGICKFNEFFGVWFFNGAFLKDPKNILRNAQEGKTKAMRHWNFHSTKDIDDRAVLAYMNEAIDNQKNGRVLQPQKKASKKVIVPTLLQQKLEENKNLHQAFDKLTPYKQNEYCEYIAQAKQEATKQRRLDKVLPMIKEGKGLNDLYRKS